MQSVDGYYESLIQKGESYIEDTHVRTISRSKWSLRKMASSIVSLDIYIVGMFLNVPVKKTYVSNSS